ncbi:MAG: SH3 domain-containing protein [Bacteroidota bacterium]
MAQKQPAPPNKLQFILLGGLLLLVIIWANRQCSRNEASYVEAQYEQRRAQQRADSLAQAPAAAPSRPAPRTQREPAVRRDTMSGGSLQIIREKSTPLFITINNLALRSGPGLQFEIIDRLPLYTEVNFLNEVTDSLSTIKLGTITPTKPWVKIRSPKGRDGWVYGAGVDFYKYKLEGVE